MRRGQLHADQIGGEVHHGERGLRLRSAQSAKFFEPGKTWGGGGGVVFVNISGAKETWTCRGGVFVSYQLVKILLS